MTAILTPVPVLTVLCIYQVLYTGPMFQVCSVIIFFAALWLVNPLGCYLHFDSLCAAVQHDPSSIPGRSLPAARAGRQPVSAHDAIPTSLPQLHRISSSLHPFFCPCIQGPPSSSAHAVRSFATTIHILVSAVIKVAREMRIPQGLVLYRGLGGDMKLPDQFYQPDYRGCRGYMEWGFLSTTTSWNTAVEVQSSLLPPLSAPLKPTSPLPLLKARPGLSSKRA